MIVQNRENTGLVTNRVLIVDDEEIVMVALRETLRRENLDVVATTNPVTALEALKKEQFAVILTDQQMPVLSGLELLAQAKSIQPDATRILITAVLSLGTVIDAINKGEIYRFIVKPWLREELLVTVKNALQRYELIRRNAQLQETTLAMNEKLVNLNATLENQVKITEQQNQQLARLNQALEHNLQTSVQLCQKTIQTFYPTLGTQARRVFELCRSIADGLNLSKEEREVLEISAWLHDIGLVGVPRDIIRRWQVDAASLNEAETHLIQHHPILGEELAGFVHHLAGVGKVIRSHHERFDGNGYPDQLAADQIPWLARLLAVAVHYASSSYTNQQILEDIKLSSGTAFDPEAVRAFFRSLPKAVVPRREREVLLSELRPGMVIAKGIYTAHGMLLIPEGQQLSETYIEKLLNHNRIQPITQSLVVYC